MTAIGLSTGGLRESLTINFVKLTVLEHLDPGNIKENIYLALPVTA